MGKFYVYEHWRPDLDVCFYVGKGHGTRSADMKRSRNRHHKGIQRKLSSLGMCVEVRMIESGLSEQDAFDLEIERIAFWISSDVKLANKTGGGEGSTNPPPEARARLAELARLLHTGRKDSLGVREKRRASVIEALKNPEVLARMGAASKARWDDPAMRDKIMTNLMAANATPEVFAKRSAAQKGNRKFFGKTHSEKTKFLMGAVQRERYEKNPVSEETRARMSAGQKKRFANAKSKKDDGA